LVEARRARIRDAAAGAAALLLLEVVLVQVVPLGVSAPAPAVTSLAAGALARVAASDRGQWVRRLDRSAAPVVDRVVRGLVSGAAVTVDGLRVKIPTGEARRLEARLDRRLMRDVNRVAVDPAVMRAALDAPAPRSALAAVNRWLARHLLRVGVWPLDMRWITVRLHLAP
jgi:hypothetical protein